MALARFQQTLTDEAGNIMVGGALEVRRESDAAPAPLYSDRDGSTAIGSTVIADADGFVAFYVAGGAYRLTAAFQGQARVWRHVAIGTAAEYDVIDEADMASASPSHVPSQQSVKAFVEAVAAALEMQNNNTIYKLTWATLAAKTPADGTPGEVDISDAGTHTDPVVGGTVANAGRYTYVAAAPGWRRTGNSLVGAILPAASDAETIAGALTSKSVTPHAARALLNTLLDIATAPPADMDMPIVDPSGHMLGALMANGEWMLGDGSFGRRVETTEGDMAHVVSRDGRLLVRVTREGLPGIAGIGQFETFEANDEIFALGDRTGRDVLRIGEIARARGARSGLDVRLNQALDAYGNPRRPTQGEWYMREARARLAPLRYASGASSQLTIAVIGDSYNQNPVYYSGPLTKMLKGRFGDAGAGYVSFAFFGGNPSNINGNVEPDRVTCTLTGSWTSSYKTSYLADISHTSSSTAGDAIQVTGYAGHSAATLHYIGTGGALRYRWNGGAWTSITLSGTGLQTVALAGVPAGIYTLDIEVVSGTVTAGGIDFRSSANGVRMHKLGASGATANDWAGTDAAGWQAAMSALAPNAVIYLIGTNDIAANVSPDAFAAQIATTIDRLRTAVASSDIILAMPAQNAVLTAPRAIAELSAVTRRLAATKRCTFVDLQYFFGEDPSEYKDGTARSWIAGDGIHPSTAGGYAYAEAFYRLIAYS